MLLIQRLGFSACAILTVVLSLLPNVSAAEADKAIDRPRLFVMVVFDQMRGDYISRWEPYFGEGGFRRLQKEGAWFQNCHYPYAGTLTGAGHASLLAGCSPETHGIVANEWYLRGTGTSMNCVASLKHDRVPPAPPTLMSNVGKVSPENFKAETFGDVLNQATSNDARIVALSFKDRSATLPAGRKPDACYWFDPKTGTFITSTYYGEALHPWVEKLNDERLPDQWFTKEWTRLRSDLDYASIVGPDDVKGEGTGSKQGRTFPHPMNGGLDKPGQASYEALYASPFASELLLTLAKRAIDAEELGTHDVPDMLTVSFSSNDAIGHVWGPDSQEVMDVTLRSDLIVKELLEHLDSKVGRGKYILAISADHGVCSIPEVAFAQGKDAGRISTAELRKNANQRLEAEFGKSASNEPRWIEAISNGWIYLNQKTLLEEGVSAVKAEQALGAWLRTQTGIAAAYTSEQIKAGIADNDTIGQRVRRSYFAGRCGDVLIVLKPQWLLGDYTTGTTHGSPYEYDSHVPLLVYGPGIIPGIRSERVSPTAIGPIFARSLGAKPLVNSNTPVPEGLFKDGAAK